VTGPIRTWQNAPRGQLHPMIRIPGLTVKMYEVVIGEGDKTSRQSIPLHFRREPSVIFWVSSVRYEEQ
jgi:hypothetical protein